MQVTAVNVRSFVLYDFTRPLSSLNSATVNILHNAQSGGTQMPKRDLQDLDQRELVVLEYIRQYIKANHGNKPSVRDITVECRHSSTSVTDGILKRLEEKGWIGRQGLKARSIYLRD